MTINSSSAVMDEGCCVRGKHLRDLSRELRRVGEGNVVVVGEGSDEHHAAGDQHGEDGSDEGVEAGPLEVGEAQALFGDAALLEEQLPRSNRRADDGDDQEDEVSRDPAAAE